VPHFLAFFARSGAFKIDSGHYAVRSSSLLEVNSLDTQSRPTAGSDEMEVGFRAEILQTATRSNILRRDL
jgi:hypothetical protein